MNHYLKPMILCLHPKCGFALTSGGWNRHLTSAHKLTVTAQELKDVGDVMQNMNQQEPKSLTQGLMLHWGLVCNSCGCCMANSNSWRKHKSQEQVEEVLEIWSLFVQASPRALLIDDVARGDQFLLA